LMMSLWDALRMNMMISYQELVRTFPNADLIIYSVSNMQQVTNSTAINSKNVSSILDRVDSWRC
ncbi:hypothetical protein BEH69_19355, partial [Citrobacter freundii]